MKALRQVSFIKYFQKWLTTSFFAIALTYFVLRLMGIQFPSMSDFIPQILILTAILGLALEFWKVSLSLIGGLLLILGLQFVTETNLDIPFLSLSQWIDWGTQAVESVRWAITINSQKGIMPTFFPNTLIFLVSLLSLLSNWLLPIPVLNMFLLVAPMFYLNDLTVDSRWLIFLLIGLFCVYSSYAYRQDERSLEQRPPILFGLTLILLTFALQTVIPPTAFFNDDLSKSLNALTPQEGGEISSFSLQEMGYYPQGNLRIGGPVELNDEAFMTVQAPATSFYLRGSAYDSFDGNSWSLSEPQLLEEYDWDGNYFDQFGTFISDTFWFASPYERDIALNNAIFKPMVYTLRTEDPTKIVFHGGKPVWLGYLANEVPPTAEFEEVIDRYSEGGEFFFSTNGMVVSGRDYDQSGITVLDSVVPVLNTWSTEVGIETFSMMEPMRGEAKNELASLVLEHDRELHDLLYLSDMPFNDLINAMRSHFDQNYTYNLTVPNIPNGQLFLDHFLMSKEGYCVYFATAWSELLADIGYETRYAEGFVVPQYAATTPEEQTNILFDRVVTGEQAHAWTEIYVDGFGWYPLEATPSDYINSMSNTNPYEHVTEPEIEESSEEITEPEPEVSSEQMQESSIQESSSEESLEDLPEDEEEEIRDIPILPILIVLLVLAALAFFAYRKLTYWKERQTKASLNQFGTNGEELVSKVWKHIKRLNRLLGLSVVSEDTIKSLMDRYVSNLDEENRERVLNVLHEVHYGNKNIDADEVNLLHDYYVYLEQKVKESMNPVVWFIRDVLTIPGRPW